MHRVPSLDSKKNRVLLAAGMAALLALGLPSCNRGDEAEEEGGSARTVRVAAVERDDLVESLSLVGELQGIEEVRILPMVNDTVRRMAVREGDRVAAGDLLAIVSSDFTSQAVEQAEAALEAASANRDALEREVGRLRPLVEAGSAPRSQLDGLEAQLRAARAQVRQAAGGAGQASVQQGRTVIRSPISGVVAAVMGREGEIAAPTMPLLTVVKPHPLKVVVRAPERHFLRIREGMPVTVSPVADPGRLVEAEVSLKGPVVDRMTRTGLLEIVVDNEEGHLVPGSLVRAVVELGRRRDVVVVPAEAILLTGQTEATGRAMAFVAEGDKARRRDLVIGSRQGERLEIVEGLSEGDLLITRGGAFLRDGGAIRYPEGEPAGSSGGDGDEEGAAAGGPAGAGRSGAEDTSGAETATVESGDGEAESAR